jgi:hypothetical protein
MHPVSNVLAPDNAIGNARDGRRSRIAWLRLPPFRLAWSLCAFVLIAFAAWPVMDAQFAMTRYAARQFAGLHRVEADPAFVAAGFWDEMWRSVRRWDRLGSRLLLFFSMCFVGVAGTIILAVHLRRHPTRRRFLTVACLLAASIAIWSSFARIEQSAIQWHAIRALPRFKSAATSLRKKWPTEAGKLSEAGDYFAYPEKRPNLLLLRRDAGYPMAEDFGRIVERSESGAIMFTLSGAVNYRLEIHPPGSEPGSFTDSFGKVCVILEAVPLPEAGWYLVRYGS